ncbi:MAG: hybrid sensor histidine kinase/response regulator, partial [Verrucomicrobia bacterium]
AGRVASREAELRQLNQDLEQRVGLRTSELSEANRSLAEAREEALRLLARERELSELKSEFVSLVSHEFRTPLEIIMSSVDNLDRYHDRLPLEKRQQLLRTVNKSVRRMSGMMEEVLVLGRLETDKMTFKPATFDLRSLCQRICDEIESAMGKRCPIRLEMNGTPENANGDESLLRHIFTNLLSNAVKYSSPDQRVDFIVHREEHHAICRVADRGCGIPEGDQKRLFQAFHRGSNVRQIPETGLGLLIVQRCVVLHGGDIRFESAEGQGTTFTVRLPLFIQTPVNS